MTNPYSPPNSPTGTPTETRHSSLDKRAKRALRPFGVVVVVVLFFVFSAVDVVALFVDGDIWWIVSLALSGLLVFLFRKLWWGDAREREIAVCFGFFLAAIIFLGMPEGPPQSWPLGEYANLAEGCYFLCAASYLAYSKRNPFFGN